MELKYFVKGISRLPDQILNTFDSRYRFRIGKISDASSVQCFYNSVWKKNHIIGNDFAFFLYEYLDKDKINILICEDKKRGNAIVGCLGFCDYSRGDDVLSRCISTSMIAIDKYSSPMPMLGVELYRRLDSIICGDGYCGVNTNPKTMLPIFEKVFGHNVGKMRHLLLLNSKKIKHFDPAHNRLLEDSESNSVFEVSNGLELKQFCSDRFQKIYAEIDCTDGLPFKSFSYLYWKYFSHPVYRFRAYSISLSNRVVGILFLRAHFLDGIKVLRVIDYFGDMSVFGCLDVHLRRYIEAEGFDYLDMRAFFCDDTILDNTLFIDVDSCGLKIPHYFEPFCAHSVDTFCHSSCGTWNLFMGDADGARMSNRGIANDQRDKY